MPGGLPEVVQKFSADSSGYSAALAAMVRDNQGLVKSIGDVQRKIKDLAGDLGALSDRHIKVDVDTTAALAGIAAVKAALAGLGNVHAGTGAASAALGGHSAALNRNAAALGGHSAALNSNATALNGNATALGGHSAALNSNATALGNNATALGGHSAALGGHAAAVQAHNALLNANVRALRRQAVAAQQAAAALNVLAAAQQGQPGGPPPVLAVPGGGGGGGGAGGGLPGGAGAFVPWRGGGFQAVKFWGMAIAEFAATAVPALIAAGSAAAVGMQGAQDVMIRAKAIGAASQSIGPAFGQSTSSYLGLPGTLSQYQDAARGGVYELAGAGINFARMGKGTFGQMGMNTLGMIDRGTANMLINYQKRQAAGGGLGDMLGGGTQWLRRYGDLFSNLGNTVMNLAPYEPGIGGDVLNTLVGGTGFLKQATQDIPGPLLGAIMAAEGGGRWGKAILGGKGLLGRVLGLGKVGGIGGLLSKGGTALMGASSPMLAGAGYGIAGIGDALATFGGPISIAAALGAFEYSQLNSIRSQAQNRVAGLQTSVGNAGFSAAFSPLAHAIVTTTGLAASAPHVAAPTRLQLASKVGPGLEAAYAMTDKNVYTQAAQGFTQTAADLINAGPQLVSALKKAGLKGVSMADAFQIAQNALLDTSHAFDKHGKLNQNALQMLSNYGAAIKPMTQSAGGFNAAIAAQQIMGSSQMKSLAGVNQMMDSMTQVMTGGPAGMAALFGMLGGTPVTTKHGGLKIAAGPAYSAMAKALGSFTTTAGAGAWNTFAGPQGLIAAEQQNLDQLRTYMTLGALPLQGKSGAQGIAGFQLAQMLPLAAKSPAALAMLMQQGAQMGIGGYYQGGPGNLKQNYQAEERALANMAGSAAQINRGMNNAVIASSNLPKTAARFSQAVGADLQSKLAAAASADVVKLKTTLGHAGSSALIGDLVSQFKTAGFQAGPALMSGINATLKGAGFSAAQIRAIDVKVKADTSQAQSQINGIHGKTVHVPTHADVAAAQAAINSIHGKTVTITVVENILAGNLSIPGAGPGGVPYTPAGVAANAPGVYTHRASGGRIPGYGGGDIVPAMVEPGELILPKHAAADPVAAALAAKYRLPGYAGGGFVGQAAYGPGAYWGTGSKMAMWNPALYAQLLAAMQASQGQGAFAMPQGLHALTAGGSTRAASGGPTGHGTAIIFGPEDTKAAQKAGSQLAVHVIEGMHGGMKDTTSEARKLARSLVSRIQQEVQYAQGVAQSAQYGQGYDPSGHGSGIFGNMQTGNPSGLSQAQMHASPTGNIKDYNAYVAAYAADTVGGANQPKSVQDQMKDYLGTVKSFGTDIGKLRKQHLNKQVLAQLIAAGPEQGDALAKSILGGKGGVSAVNKLWSAIGGASKKLGSQAAMGQFGGTLAPNLKSGTFINNNVSVNVTLPAGHAGDLSLSASQINQLVSIIQKKLLQQAKRNNKTGVKLPGKGS